MNSPTQIPQEEWDLIETYLDHKGTGNEAQELKQKVSELTDSTKKIKHVQKVRKEMEDSIRQSKIKEFHKHIPMADDSKATRRIRFKPHGMWYAMAAVLVLLFGLFWMLKEDNTSEKIFAAHFKPDIGLPLKMGTKNEYGFYEGMVDYKQGNYKEAIAQWELLLNEKPENDTLNYFLGVTYLAEGNSEKSLEYLEPNQKFTNGIFSNEAPYYTALAKIKEGKFEAAKKLLMENPSEKNTTLLKSLPK